MKKYDSKYNATKNEAQVLLEEAQEKLRKALRLLNTTDSSYSLAEFRAAKRAIENLLDDNHAEMKAAETGAWTDIVDNRIVILPRQ